MELPVAFGMDDGENLTNGHAGDAKYFYLYKFSDSKEEKSLFLRTWMPWLLKQ